MSCARPPADPTDLTPLATTTGTSEMSSPTETEVLAMAKAARVPHRWRNLFTMTGTLVVDSTEGSITATLFPTIAAALRLTAANLGSMTALGKIASVPTGPAWVWLAGRIGRKNTLILTTLGGGLFGILAGLANGFGMLLLFNTLMAASIAGGAPITNSVLADTFEDKDRAKAAGIFYAVLNGVASFIGPVIALFTNLHDGWRYAMWTIGAICLLASLLVAVGFKEPTIGAAEKQLADLAEQDRIATRVSWSSVVSLFRIPTYSIMMLSRLLSGHLLISVFGIVFLVSVRGFSNATAALVLIPFGIGYLVGSIGGGYVVALLDRTLPSRGRVWFIQFAQLAFAAVAFFATQIPHGRGIGVYCVFWALMAIAQGFNVPLNRPIVAAVILPELRGQGFAIWLSIFETIGWALFSLVAGDLAASLGITTVFLWVLVILMVVNALVLGLLHLTYPRDVARVAATLDQRRAIARGHATI